MESEIDRNSSQLKALRVKMKMTSKALALKAGLDKSSISLYENGRRQPTPETAIKLADALGLDPKNANEAAAALGLRLADKTGRPRTKSA